MNKDLSQYLRMLRKSGYVIVRQRKSGGAHHLIMLDGRIVTNCGHDPSAQNLRNLRSQVRRGTRRVRGQ
jgi:hypothetical protein